MADDGRWAAADREKKVYIATGVENIGGLHICVMCDRGCELSV